MVPDDKSTSERKRVLLVGQVNSGKSSLFNRLLRQSRSLVSEQAGTTTDSVEKLLELPGVGPVLLIDTPGLADDTPLGDERQRVTMQALRSADVALYLLSNESTLSGEVVTSLLEKRVPTIPIISRSDLPEQQVWRDRSREISLLFGQLPIEVSKESEEGIKAIVNSLTQELQKLSEEAPPLLGNLCHTGDLVLLVMPQDSSAPAGRLIRPQVQTIRALLDRRCHALCVTPEELPSTDYHRFTSICLCRAPCSQGVPSHLLLNPNECSARRSATTGLRSRCYWALDTIQSYTDRRGLYACPRRRRHRHRQATTSTAQADLREDHHRPCLWA